MSAQDTELLLAASELERSRLDSEVERMREEYKLLERDYLAAAEERAWYRELLAQSKGSVRMFAEELGALAERIHDGAAYLDTELSKKTPDELLRWEGLR